jgi:MFS family permease
VVSRPIVGPISDRRGRAVVIIPCFVLTLGGMILLSLAGSSTALLIAAVVIGFGYGAVHPTLMTLAFDLAPFERRGMTMAQFHLFYDLAIGLGSVIPGIILDLTGNNYTAMFLMVTGVGALGLVLFLATYRSKLTSE